MSITIDARRAGLAAFLAIETWKKKKKFKKIIIVIKKKKTKYPEDTNPRTILPSIRVDRNSRPSCRKSRRSRNGKHYDIPDRIDL